MLNRLRAVTSKLENRLCIVPLTKTDFRPYLNFLSEGENESI